MMDKEKFKEFVEEHVWKEKFEELLEEWRNNPPFPDFYSEGEARIIAEGAYIHGS